MSTDTGQGGGMGKGFLLKHTNSRHGGFLPVSFSWDSYTLPLRYPAHGLFKALNALGRKHYLLFIVFNAPEIFLQLYNTLIVLFTFNLPPPYGCFVQSVNRRLSVGSAYFQPKQAFLWSVGTGTRLCKRKKAPVVNGEWMTCNSKYLVLGLLQVCTWRGHRGESFKRE